MEVLVGGKELVEAGLVRYYMRVIGIDDEDDALWLKAT